MCEMVSYKQKLSYSINPARTVSDVAGKAVLAVRGQ